MPALLSGAALAANPALPAGGAYVAGSGSIVGTAKSLTIDQTSRLGIIDWKSFSIGKDGSVAFDNKGGATLNRVTGGDLTKILGTLKATGTVYLINPQGVVIGKSGVVVTGGSFTASTLDVANSAFLAGGTLLFKGTTDATVKNLGSISSTGGDVFLIARSVENDGTINAANGTVGLAAGNRVLIKDASADEKVFVEAGSGDATSAGTIAAASAELKAAGGNVYALAGSNGGIIRATGTATRDGHVWLTASGGTMSVTGTVQATNVDGTGGAITAKGATLKIAGKAVIDAAGTKGHGTIETSGHKVSIRSARVSAGKDGSWLVDPNDLTIDATLAATIDNALDAGTNVTEQTNASGTGGSGDIFVDSDIAWDTSASLTLTAYRNIAVAKGVTISNAYSTSGGAIPGLTLYADNTGTGTGTVSFGTGGKVDFSASNGAVSVFYNPLDGASQTTVNAQRYKTTIGYAGGSPGYTAEVALPEYETPNAVMLVNNVYDLQNMRNNLAASYALGRDIDASATARWHGGAGFIPVGSGKTPPGTSGYGFYGSFDGQGHVIEGLTIDRPTTQFVGLFGFIGSPKYYGRTAIIIRNVGLTSVNITGDGDVGALVGYNESAFAPNPDSVISGVYVTGSVSGSSFVGGLVGVNEGPIENSHNGATVSGQAYVGGLVGEARGSITDDYSTGAVQGGSGSSYVGGLVGFNVSQITNSYSTGPVSGGSYVGGLVGGNYDNITSSFATGAVTGSVDVGGLVGDNEDADIVQSYSTGAVSGVTAVGGFVGFADGELSTITHSYSTGAVSGKSKIGGLVGQQDFGAIVQSDSAGRVLRGTGSNNVGGLVGSNTGTVTQSYWDKTTSGLAGSSAGTGLTTAQMASRASYAGWDFANIWYLVPGMAHPILRSELWGTTIVNAHQLELIGQNATTLAGQYTLGANVSMAELGSAAGPWLTAANASIDGGGYGFVSIGSLATPFTGSLKGQGYTIDGLTIHATGNYVGLFGYLGSGGVLTDFGLTDLAVSGVNYVGGLVGNTTGGTITEAYVSGSVAGAVTVGGLVGNSTNGAIGQSFSTGSVSATGNNAGGLVGYNRGGAITQSFSTAAVSGAASAGGLVGTNNAGQVSDSYAAGRVTGTSKPGGLIGSNSGAVTSSYWDTQASGQSHSKGGAGLTTAQLQSGLPSGFDPTVWGSKPGDYPYLLWLYPNGP